MQQDASGIGWERLFWFVFQNSTHPIALIDDNRQVVEANDAALEVAQRTRIEVLGTFATDFLSPADRAESDRRWESIINTDTGEYFGSGTLLRGDGSEVEIEFAARMVQVGGRRLAGPVILEFQVGRRHRRAGRIGYRHREFGAEVLGADRP